MSIFEEKWTRKPEKHLIWYGHVERMDPMRLPKSMINWKPERRKETRSSTKNLERWDGKSHE
jgi:hypothetical protein